MQNEMEKKFDEVGLEDLPEVAKYLLSIGQNRILALYGPMGAGKTTLSRQIAREWGVLDQVSSPTFSLVNEYRNADGEAMYHFDFYRIKEEEEALAMGCEDYFFSGNTCLVEWPEKIPNLMPQDVIRVNLSLLASGKRTIEITKAHD